MRWVYAFRAQTMKTRYRRKYKSAVHFTIWSTSKSGYTNHTITVSSFEGKLKWKIWKYVYHTRIHRTECTMEKIGFRCGFMLDCHATPSNIKCSSKKNIKPKRMHLIGVYRNENSFWIPAAALRWCDGKKSAPTRKSNENIFSQNKTKSNQRTKSIWNACGYKCGQLKCDFMKIIATNCT